MVDIVLSFGGIVGGVNVFVVVGLYFNWGRRLRVS